MQLLGNNLCCVVKFLDKKDFFYTNVFLEKSRALHEPTTKFISCVAGLYKIDSVFQNVSNVHNSSAK